MPLNELGTKAILQRIIDILRQTSSPDLRLKSSSGTIAQYIFGKPDERELNDTYPVIWVEAGGVGGDLVSEAGFGNTSQIAHMVTVTVGMLVRHANAQTAEKNAIDLHDDIRVTLRNYPDLAATNIDASYTALAQRLRLAWPAMKESSQQEGRTDFTVEIALVTRWVLLEDV